MKKFRIAIYSGVIPSTTFIENLLQGVADAGHSVYLFGRLKKRPIYSGKVPIYATPTAKWQVVFFVLWHQFRLRLQSPQHFKQLQEHINNIEIPASQRWRSWAKYLPVVLHLPDVFHIQWAKATEEWLFLKELFGVNLILSLRGTHINYSPVADAVLAASYRYVFPKIDGFHSVSSAIAKKAAKYGATSDRIKVVYSGIELLKIRLFEKKSYQVHTTLKLLSVGRFHWIKGYSYALDTIRLLINKGYEIEYTLIAGEVSEEILYQIYDLGLQSYVRIIDHLPQAEVFQYMQEADLLLLPSVEEGIANVVLEAMAIGLPVLSSDCGGMEEVIENGVNGMLFQNRSVAVLAAQIIHFLQLDTQARQQMAQYAQNTIQQQFTRANMIADMLALYEQVLKSKPVLDENRLRASSASRLF